MFQEVAWPLALLLDFYGTVVEEDDAIISRICDQIVATSPLGSNKAEIAAYWDSVFGEMCTQSHGAAFRTQRELEQDSLCQVLERFGSGLDAVELSEPLFAYWKQPAIFPESKEVLERWDRPICVVSNIDEHDLREALAFHDLSFDGIVTSETCRAYKPRKEMFLRALSLLDLPAQDVLHVGDSLRSDVAGAKALGIPAMWINRNGRPTPRTGPAPDFITADLRAIENC